VGIEQCSCAANKPGAYLNDLLMLALATAVKTQSGNGISVRNLNVQDRSKQVLLIIHWWSGAYSFSRGALFLRAATAATLCFTLLRAVCGWNIGAQGNIPPVTGSRLSINLHCTGESDSLHSAAGRSLLTLLLGNVDARNESSVECTGYTDRQVQTGRTC
jgi:hypothetical protein